MSLILAVYLVIQVLILSSVMTLQIDLTIHAITMTLACVAYFIVAFKNVLSLLINLAWIF